MRGSSAYGAISTGSVVMAYTGWDERWNREERFRNLESDRLTHYPGFSLEAREVPGEDARRGRAGH